MDGDAGTIAYIGLGANLGEPLQQCRYALRKIGNGKDVRLLRASSFYRTEPVGVADQGWFVNAVAELRTTLTPRQLLARLQKTEQELGRRESRRWGPRIIDLDIILYGQKIVREDDLVIPHPECHRRRFVLVPMCELAGYMVHPVFGISMRGLLSRLEGYDRATVVPIEQEAPDGMKES
ncbi:MAG TPA: 2-amino-4-hydroxy-6-hydroxymethyldihydropteridine diphosphokinase [Syntrophales bacterium]|jgi:2-amino-4-hydroxy-6-hydroxymethyldihydropteridine diphosphokinase|nr:2-amino-4-hydroxy-6-hydroxymethyldihydropteridine diphosphokinase [Syntrophales bacterium]HON24106.1 2-amino-4-hydroxy-6-hydroxymethyldihydropteridine diphosphokinase [Syntrophales bacterium]HOU76624.1 2-amino-4-hydroxy-6-hydroxymethyldihydropteridine diphosphokinase [Syntrophales bacterium]HPC31381.1 2-amino-4-hydroxy-6-hydroxymethyldihydropteridine diphosphokinase [Syntrophales bacterium]HQG33287.1 2-amino-4-hydroxy-6-hydroxymethyldihydropteridine diphosphokinase [Syntrophales bacterium]